MFCRGTYFIQTFGCQMNEYDSSLVDGILRNHGLIPAQEGKSADYLLINTCSVRRHAEERVFSLLSQYKNFKVTNPAMKIVLLGCMASRHREKLLERFPHLDLAVGPDGYRNLPKLLAGDMDERSLWLGDNPLEDYDDIAPIPGQITAGIAIARGCDNFCSYCVVPYVRGEERSRPVKGIIGEIEFLADSGVREITLLGQNVNSYRSQGVDFAGLIRRANEVPGIRRVRFMTSHPKDLSDGLLEAMAECEKLAPHLHLPFQAGSDRILALMNRGYTHDDYLRLVERARKRVPGISLTTDIIAGFPSESEADFEETLDLVREVRFDDAFTYRYSIREGTRAAGLPDDVPEEVKLERLGLLISLVRKTARENLDELRGENFSVLIERASKKSEDWWMGRTEHNRVSVMPRGDFLPGDMIDVVVEDISGFTLRCATRLQMGKQYSQVSPRLADQHSHQEG